MGAHWGRRSSSTPTPLQLLNLTMKTLQLPLRPPTEICGLARPSPGSHAVPQNPPTWRDARLACAHHSPHLSIGSTSPALCAISKASGWPLILFAPLYVSVRRARRRAPIGRGPTVSQYVPAAVREGFRDEENAVADFGRRSRPLSRARRRPRLARRRLSAFCAPRAFRLKLGYDNALLEGALAHHLVRA